MADNLELSTVLQDYVPRADYEAALEAADLALAERDTHRTEAEARGGRLAELEKKLRGKTWREAYSKIAKELKVDPKFEDDVFDLLKVEPDADEPDPKAFRRSIEAFLEAKKHFVQDAAPRPKEIPAGEGHGRGRPVAPGEPEMRVTRRQLNDAVYMREHQKSIGAAQKAGLLVIDDD